MQLESATSTQEILPINEQTDQDLLLKEERRRTGRYVAVGATLAILLIAFFHVFARNTSSIAEICIPVIVMVTYVIWVLYAARKSRIRARRLASASYLSKVVDRDNSCLDSGDKEKKMTLEKAAAAIMQ